MEAQSNKIVSYFILGLLIALGLIGAGYYSGQAIAQLKASQRYLTVKGLSEHEVKANLAVWEIDYREVDNDLTAANQRLQHDQQVVINYLHQQGFTDDEIELRPAKVNDLFANPYNSNNNAKFRYIVTSGVRVRSTKVDLIQKVNQQTSDLIQQGIPLSFNTSDYSSDLDPNPSYYFTQLDSIRPQMLSEATQSAFTIAQQFAKDSNSQLAGIGQASQGVFQIASRDSVTSTINNSGQNEASSVYKKVRLVTTIQYILK